METIHNNANALENDEKKKPNFLESFRLTKYIRFENKMVF